MIGFSPFVALSLPDIPPRVKHWHGALPTAGKSHIALSEAVDGKVVDWLEHVTDAQYRGE
ncbi:hypothetical protein HNR00_003257 [Methylorubrum rhodinum]|uniref:Uncharacterized protein n=1 Tax=Methylorubrum rhodinum TaxID=29428 RepID=A0A840ZNA6_9HYPH|nr:hypothetical protein [Methylorubrum rhodinum]